MATVKATAQGKVVLVQVEATLQVVGTCQLTSSSPVATTAVSPPPPPPAATAALPASSSAVKYNLPLSSIPQSLLTLLTLPQTNHLPPTMLEPYLSLTPDKPWGGRLAAAPCTPRPGCAQGGAAHPRFRKRTHTQIPEICRNISSSSWLTRPTRSVSVTTVLLLTLPVNDLPLPRLREW